MEAEEGDIYEEIEDSQEEKQGESGFTLVQFQRLRNWITSDKLREFNNPWITTYSFYFSTVVVT